MQLQKHDHKSLDEFKRTFPTLLKWIEDLVYLMSCVLFLPIKQRMTAFQHLEHELSIKSREDTRIRRLEFTKLKKEKVEFKHIEKEKLNNHNKQLKKAEAAIQMNNLGLEHLIREFGSYHDELVHQGHIIHPRVEKSIRGLAELVAEGQVVELVNGDSGRISGQWFMRLMNYINEVMPGMKIYTISIIGEQSSGKSTLLNSLFGCKFSVSAGRCTRGLFLRLILMDDDLKKRYGCDAVLLIDTEGMCAPERINDANGEQYDRELATFAMLISDLTIVNIMGETMTEMTNILQIVVVAMSRLENTNASPEILLVQHCQEVDSGRLEVAVNNMIEAVKKAIETTSKDPRGLGVVNSTCSNKLLDSLEFGDILYLMHPYKADASSNSGPSVVYHEDITNLFKKLLEYIETFRSIDGTPAFKHFHDWYSVLPEYWVALKKENFAVRFKNIQEIYEFIERSKAIEKLMQKVEAAFAGHKKMIKKKLRTQVLNEKNQHASYGLVKPINIEEELSSTLDACTFIQHTGLPGNTDKASCGCYGAIVCKNELFKHIQGNAAENEVNKTVVTKIDTVKQKCLDQLEVYKTQQKAGFEQFQKMINFIPSYKKTSKGSKNKHFLQQQMYSNIVQNSSLFKRNEEDLSNVKEGIIKLVIGVYQHTLGEDRQISLYDKCDVNRLLNIQAFQSKNMETKALQSKKMQINFKSIKSKITSLIPNSNKLKLDFSEVQKLAARIENFCGDNLKTHLEMSESSIKALRKSIDDMLDNLFKETFEPKFLWEIHIFAMQMFLEKHQEKYLKQMHQKKYEAAISLLPKMIDAHFKHEKKHEIDATILAETVLFGIFKKSKQRVENIEKTNILRETWISTVEFVRIKFFHSLFEEVSDEMNIENFVLYTKDPNPIISSWFREEVDRTDRRQLFNDAGTIFNNEVTKLWARFTDVDQFRSGCLEYLSNIEGLFYTDNSSKLNASESKDFFNICMAILTSGQERFLEEHENSSLIKRCSDSNAVMSRIGCLEKCPYCKAVCWGHREHVENSDATRRHHTCHQPLGLVGVTTMDGKPVPFPCDKIPDDWRIRLSIEDKAGREWLICKHGVAFNDWMFYNHSMEEYDELMMFAFLKLNKQISKQYGMEPLTEDEKKSLGYEELAAKAGKLLNLLSAKIDI